MRKVDPGRLELGVLVERVQRLVAAGSRLLEAAEGDGDVVGVVTVHVNHPGAERLRDPVRLADVARPDRGCQPVFDTVADAHGLVGILHRDGGQHRAEDLLSRDAHVCLHVRKDRRSDVAAARLLEHALAARQQSRAFGPAGVDVAEHGPGLHLVDDGTHARHGIEGIARLHRTARFDDFLEHAVTHALLDNEA